MSEPEPNPFEPTLRQTPARRPEPIPWAVLFGFALVAVGLAYLVGTMRWQAMTRGPERIGEDPLVLHAFEGSVMGNVLAWLLLLAIVFLLLVLPYLVVPFWAGSYTLFRRSSTNGETLAILLIITATLFGDRVVGCLQVLLRLL